MPPARTVLDHKPLVLHVSGDFPDPIESFKTKAIRNLIDLTHDEFDHHVISINRASPPPKLLAKEILSPQPLIVEAQNFEYGTALRYFAPARGIRHATKLRQLGDWVADEIAKMPRRPDLIVGHKLAIEGLAVAHTASISGLPFGISIQGDSDTKIMDFRRDLKADLQAVLHEAQVAFPFAPWAWDRVIERLGAPKKNRHIILPCATELDEPLPPLANGNGLLSVFHLESYKRKNLSGITRAVTHMTKHSSAPKVTVIGGGDQSARDACEALVATTPSVSLAGAKGREQVRSAMNCATAFVLPSLRESFGLVFIEALFAGVPIIYPRGTSIDGYFNNAPFALAVNARDPRSIATAMQKAIERETEMKEALARWQQSSDALRFKRSDIAAKFAAGLNHAINSP